MNYELELRVSVEHVEDHWVITVVNGETELEVIEAPKRDAAYRIAADIFAAQFEK